MHAHTPLMNDQWNWAINCHPHSVRQTWGQVVCLPDYPGRGQSQELFRYLNNPRNGWGQAAIRFKSHALLHYHPHIHRPNCCQAHNPTAQRRFSPVSTFSILTGCLRSHNLTTMPNTCLHQPHRPSLYLRG